MATSKSTSESNKGRGDGASRARLSAGGDTIGVQCKKVHSVSTWGPLRVHALAADIPLLTACTHAVMRRVLS